jgi:hypothetical protein
MNIRHWGEICPISEDVCFSFLLSVHGHFNSFGSGLFFCIFLH